MRYIFKFSIVLLFLLSSFPNLLFSNDLIQRIKLAEKSVSDAEDAFAIGSKGHFKSLEDLMVVRKKLVKAKEMYAEIKTYEDKLDTAHYKNTTIRILNDLETLTKYIIEHSGLDPKH
tara:strand:+ start:929 stop:1279 length:351 start_codon:yes stop_codon:yes gene_type:complete